MIVALASVYTPRKNNNTYHLNQSTRPRKAKLHYLPYPPFLQTASGVWSLIWHPPEWPLSTHRTTTTHSVFPLSKFAIQTESLSSSTKLPFELKYSHRYGIDKPLYVTDRELSKCLGLFASIGQILATQWTYIFFCPDPDLVYFSFYIGVKCSAPWFLPC